jgi:hypothetical protein
MSTPSAAAPTDLDRLQWWALGVGAAALVVCVVGAVFSAEQFFCSYLVAYLLCLGLALGSLVVLMVYHLTGGAWGFTIRRFLEAGMRTLPLLAILFVPLAFGLRYLYPWAQPEVVAADEGLQHKQIYLNVPFFLVRAALYFAVWLVLAYFLDAWSRREDAEGDFSAQPRRFRLLSGPGLVLYGLTVTFAATDWVMSLQPHWSSTILPPLFATGQLLAGYAFVLAVMLLVVTPRLSGGAIAPAVLNDLGNLLLTFVILWTYMAFSQFLLIWIGNLPEEAIWYRPRLADGWQGVAVALALFHFALPFLLLLSRDVKRNPRSLGLVAASVLFMRLVDLDWQVLPTFPGTAVYQHWMDVLAPVGVGGVWLACYLWQLQRRPLWPLHDPNRQEAGRLPERGLQEATHHG